MSGYFHLSLSPSCKTGRWSPYFPLLMRPKCCLHSLLWWRKLTTMSMSDSWRAPEFSLGLRDLLCDYKSFSTSTDGRYRVVDDCFGLGRIQRTSVLAVTIQDISLVLPLTTVIEFTSPLNCK